MGTMLASVNLFPHISEKQFFFGNESAKQRPKTDKALKSGCMRYCMGEKISTDVFSLVTKVNQCVVIHHYAS